MDFSVFNTAIQKLSPCWSGPQPYPETLKNLKLVTDKMTDKEIKQC